ncbi:MAG: hypothetical protein ACI89X_004733, partial [Planctomycetota bacterium]
GPEIAHGDTESPISDWADGCHCGSSRVPCELRPL